MSCATTLQKVKIISHPRPAITFSHSKERDDIYCGCGSEAYRTTHAPISWATLSGLNKGVAKLRINIYLYLYTTIIYLVVVGGLL